MKRIFFYSFLFLAIAFSFVKIFTRNDYQYQLSVVAIFQNEDRFLKEWLDFYRVLGVEHFYLYNNLSDDHYEKVLEPYIQAGLVELHDWPFESQPGNEANWTRIQSAAYRQGLDLSRGKSKWVALIDTDEFMFPTEKDQTLVEFLKDYEECSGILVNWQLFGTSHCTRIPDNQLLIETLVMQTPKESEVNKRCKSIVRPEKVKYCCDPYAVDHYPWSYSLDSDKRMFPWKFHASRPINIDKIRINHYWSRDEEFFYTNKLSRYENWGNHKLTCLQRNEEANQILNTDILQWVPKVRELQNNDPLLSSL